MKLEPVDFNPFEQEDAAASVELEPVDFNPFADEQEAPTLNQRQQEFDENYSAWTQFKNAVERGAHGISAGMSMKLGSLPAEQKADKNRVLARTMPYTGAQEAPITPDNRAYMNPTEKEYVAQIDRNLADMDRMGEGEWTEDHVKDAVRSMVEAGKIPMSPAARDFLEADTFSGAWDLLKRHPGAVLTEVTGSSLPASATILTTAAVGTLLGGPLGGALGSGLGSYSVEEQAGFIEGLSRAGVDVTDEGSISEALQNPDILAKAKGEASKGALPVAVFDALTAGLASKTLVPSQLIKGQVKRQATNLGVQTVVQGAGGAAGEASKQYLVEGEITAPGQVLAETAGEVVMAAPEVAILSAAARRNKGASPKADTESAQGGGASAEPTALDSQLEQVEETESAEPDAPTIEQMDGREQEVDPTPKPDDLDLAVDSAVEAANQTPVRENPERQSVQQRLPFVDDRIRNDEHKGFLEFTKQNTKKGGEVGYVKDEWDNIITRTASVNPKYVQSVLAAYRMSTDGLKRAIDKALAGEKMGGREEGAVVSLLDAMDEIEAQASGRVARQGELDETARAAFERETPDASVYDEDAFVEPGGRWEPADHDAVGIESPEVDPSLFDEIYQEAYAAAPADAEAVVERGAIQEAPEDEIVDALWQIVADQENTREREAEAADEAGRVPTPRAADYRISQEWLEANAAPANEEGVAERPEPIRAQEAPLRRASAGSRPAGGGMTASEAILALRPTLDYFKKGLEGFDVRIADTAEEIFGPGIDEGIRTSQGFYWPRSRRIVLIASNLRGPKEARRALLHEVAGHYGLNLLTPNQKREILGRIAASRSVRSLRLVWDLVDSLYPDASPELQAEEAFALLAETISDKHPLAVWWDGVLAKLAGFLRDIGVLTKERVSASELRSLSRALARGIREGKQQQTTPTSDQAQYRRDGGVSNASSKFWAALEKGAPVGKALLAPLSAMDFVVRKPFELMKVDTVTRAVRDMVTRGVVDWTPSGEGMVSRSIATILKTARSGMIDRYGLSEEFIERDMQREGEERDILMQAQQIIRGLVDRGMDAKEAAIFQRILTGEAIPDSDWNDVAAEVREVIDAMGREAVELGLVTEEAYQRNRGSYLHRVYDKHEREAGSITQWANRIASSRRKKIIGSQTKGRGIFTEVPQERLLAIAGQQWGVKAQKGKPDPSIIGRRFRVFDRLADAGDGTQAIPGTEGKQPQRRRVLERVYLPADKPIPAKYQAWHDKGEFEVRNTKGDKFVLWRDYNAQERADMGEILDARYTIAKTFSLMAHDLSVARFYRDIAENPEWTHPETEGTPDGVVTAPGGRIKTYADADWVLVPKTRVPGSQALKWGALSDRYVRAEIWRDINELDRLRTPGPWQKILTQWKLMKTARSPVVHMNNVMSNVMLMDMADIGFKDLTRGIREMSERGEHFHDAMRHGVFGHDMVTQEYKQEIMDNVLKELEKKDGVDQGLLEEKFGKMGRITALLFKGVKKADDAMLRAYAMEDEVFRMATYMRRLDQGFEPEVAAKMAREQFLDYDIRAPWINALRQSVLPFISYTYRAIPVIMNSLAERPWKLAKYMAVAHGMNALAYALAPGDEDWERRTMDESLQGDTWLGFPRMLRLPMYDEHGNPVFLDVRRWIPAGDVFDTNQGSSALPVPAPFQFGGPLMLAGELFTNRSAFTGDDIVDKTDSGLEAAGKVADHIYKFATPSAPWIPNSWYQEKLARAVTGGRDPLGRDYSLSQAALSSIGIKAQPHDPEYGLAIKKFKFDQEAREIKFKLREAARDLNRGLIDRSDFDRRVEKLQEKLLRASEDFRDAAVGSQ